MGANVLWQRLLSFFPEVVKGNSGAGPAVNWVAGTVQSLTLNAATVTPTFTAPPGGANLALVLTQDGVGGRAVTWPAAVSWLGGTAPILLSGAGQTTLVYFYFDGTTYWGSLASGASPASIIPWTAVAAGTALAASLSKPNLAADSSGGQSTITLPTAAQMAAADGFEFTIKATGAMLAPVIVTAGAGTTLELLNAPGTFGASTWLPIQGQGVVFKYDKATTTWKLRANSEGSGSPGSSAYNPNWYANAASIGWDPVAGLDSNVGSVGAPVKNFAEIVRRFGSSEPNMGFGQDVVVNQLSAQTVGVDWFYFGPQMSGGGQAKLLVTLQVLQAAFVGGVVTARAIAAPGTRLQVAGLTGAAAKQYVFNQTRNSYAQIDSVAVGVSTMSQPLTAASIACPAVSTPAPAEDNTWATGDTYIIYQRQLTNLIGWNPVGADATAGNKQCAGWVQWARIPDASAGNGRMPLVSRTCFTALSDCQIDGAIVCSAAAGSYQLIGGDYTGSVRTSAGNGTQSGGIYRAGVNHFAGTLTFQAGMVIHSNWNIKSPGIFTSGDVFADGTINLGNSGIGELYWSGQIWGSFSIVTSRGSKCINASGGTWVNNFLTTGTMKFGATTTGSSFNTGTGLWTGGTTINQTNVDAAGGLCDPVGQCCYANQ